jgi:hypothetical protein
MNWNQGTWQFMAADLIKDPTISQTFVHDLESAFYVMFWLSLKYLPNSYAPSKRGSVLSCYVPCLILVLRAQLCFPFIASFLICTYRTALPLIPD